MRRFAQGRSRLNHPVAETLSGRIGRSDAAMAVRPASRRQDFAQQLMNEYNQLAGPPKPNGSCKNGC
jgi:hypothetical protein